MTDRSKFEVPVAEALGVFNDGSDTLYIKGEYFGYFLNRCVKKYIADPNYTQHTFNSAFFNDGKRKALSNAADSIAAVLHRADPIGMAEELNYAVTAVLWAILGDANGFPPASYGVRAYLTGIIEKVMSSLDTVNSGNKSDMTMAFRRFLVARGVLHNILSETYRLKTAIYEEGKIAENGDIWDDGVLELPSSTAIEVSK